MNAPIRNLIQGLAGVIALAAALPASAYTFNDLTVPGTAGAGAVDINNNGQILFSNGLVLNTNGTTTAYTAPGAARALNDNGAIVGSFGSHGYLMTGTSGYKQLDYPGAAATQANGINDSNEVVGAYQLSGKPWQSFKYVNGTYSQVGSLDNGSTPNVAEGVNNSAIVAGSYSVSGASAGYDTAVSSYQLGDGWGTSILGLNDNNTIVGTTWTGIVLYGEGSPEGPYGFVETLASSGGTVTILTDPNDATGKSTTPYGINKAGTIVGTYVNDAGATVDFKATP